MRIRGRWLNIPAAVALLGLVAFLSWGHAAATPPDGYITTIAGNGTMADSGDGGLATDASIFIPLSVDIDASGRVYTSDVQCRIRRVTNGIIETIAGTGTCGPYQGDGGPGVSATLSRIDDIAVTAAGDVYMVDTIYCAARYLEASTGTISTVVGQVSSQTCGMSGDGGSATGPNAKMSSPIRMDATSSGVLYILDSGNCRIRKVENGIITTFAGRGNNLSGCNASTGDGGLATDADLKEPIGIAVHPNGDVYVITACTIRRISGGIIDTVVGNGNCGVNGDALPAAQVSLNWPSAIAFDTAGNLFVAEAEYFEGMPNNACLLRVIHDGIAYKLAGAGLAPTTHPMTTLCGYNGDDIPASSAMVNVPNSIEVANGDLYIADALNFRVRVIHGLDADGEGVPLGADTCPDIANPDQANTDANFVDNSPYDDALDDKTWINSDFVGDACDLDDDNDGRIDADEGGAVGCAATNPFVRDTDGDRFLDGAECAIGTDPTSAASKPTPVQCASRVSGASTHTDQDGDKLRDYVEFCNYNSNPTDYDSDHDEGQDGASDGREAASFNGDRAVNSGDQLLLVMEILRELNPRLRLHNFDINKDGAVNSGDQLLLAQIVVSGGGS